MSKQVFETIFAGKKLAVEIGQVAKQANGAALVRYGDSTVLSAAVMSKKCPQAISSHFRLIMKKKDTQLENSPVALTSVKAGHQPMLL
nr:hypothetical protein [Streptococcus mutans]